MVTLLLFGFLLLGLLLGLPLAFSFGGVAIIFSVLLWGPKSLFIIPLTAYEDGTNYILLAVPLFVFMANILEHSGIAEELYGMMYKWMGRVAAAWPSAPSSSAPFSRPWPASAAWPPSPWASSPCPPCSAGLFQTNGRGMHFGRRDPGYPDTAQRDHDPVRLSDRGVGGTALYRRHPAGGHHHHSFIAYIAIRCFINPELGPPIEERVGWREKLVSLRGVVLPIVLILLVLGVIYMGVCTPTEASAVGALGALVCALIHRKLTLAVLKQSLQRTLVLTCMVMWILIGATCFTQLYTALGAPDMLNEIISGLNLSKWFLLAFMMFVFFILGMFMDPAGIIMICTPVFIPIIKMFGFNTIWFGILFTICMEMGYITPPFGFNLFYMRAIVPSDVSMGDIYRSIVPFVLLEIVGLVIVIMFPELATWLPAMMINR